MPLPIPESTAEIETIQRERKKLAVERALRTPFWKRRLGGIDVENLDDPEEWARIPILDKDEIRALSSEAFYESFCVMRREDVQEFWRSGGSTGEPLFYPRSFEDIRYAMLGFARCYKATGCGPADTAHLSFPLGIHPAGHMWARAAAQEGITMVWAGSGTALPSRMQLELIRKLEPTLWMGMSSYGLHLANLAEAEGIDLAGGSVTKLLCTAEAVSAAKRRKIARVWGAELFDCFGMTEAGMMGAEDAAHDGFHIWTDLFFFEVLDPATAKPVGEGEEGMMVVTPLFTNNCTPFLRWNSGDIVTWRRKGAGRGPLSVFPVVRHAHRTAGFFKIRGVNVNHPEFEDFMFDIPEVNDFKLELATRDDLEALVLSVEFKRGVEGAAAGARLAEAVRNTFEVRPEVEVLALGTLAKEFEGAIKAPRFVDRRT